MNRAQRRAQARVPLPERARQLATTTFQDRISWTAAAVLLDRVVKDPAFGELDADLRGGIARFLERHPAPVTIPDRDPG